VQEQLNLPSRLEVVLARLQRPGREQQHYQAGVQMGVRQGQARQHDGGCKLTTLTLQGCKLAESVGGAAVTKAQSPGLAGSIILPTLLQGLATCLLLSVLMANGVLIWGTLQGVTVVVGQTATAALAAAVAATMKMEALGQVAASKRVASRCCGLRYVP
jgi:hypothetical protein